MLREKFPTFQVTIIPRITISTEESEYDYYDLDQKEGNEMIYREDMVHRYFDLNIILLSYRVGHFSVFAQELCDDGGDEKGAEESGGGGEDDEERHDTVDGGRVRQGLRHRRLLPRQR